MLLPEIKQFMQKGNYDETLAFIDGLGEENRLNGLIMKIRILKLKVEVKEARRTAGEALAECEKHGSILQRLVTHIYSNYLSRNTEKLALSIESAKK